MLINGIKFACHTCVKGHRSSTCNHIERPLFEIRKKGRPVTQCSYCRDLRKTKQVHIKCTCKSKTIQLQQQPHDCCPPEKGITYPEIIQNPSTISEQQSWQSTTIDPLLFHEDAFQRSMSTSSIIKHSSRKMSRKSSTTSTTSSRRSTISAPYTILQQPPFVQHHSFNQQQITELDSVITPSPPPNMGIEFPMTDPEELSFLLNNILMNSREDDMTKSTTSSHLPTTVTNTQGESVVITITPLSSSEMPVSRIVTCYCGNSCTCPGCFVHPNNNYDKLLAPTNKQTITTTSHYYYSSCSSDDEKIIY